MGTKDKQEHQPEPWTQDGRYILDASGWTLASARFPGDARRIIAAVNSVQGIPTDALESWVVNVVGEPAGGTDAAVTTDLGTVVARGGERPVAAPWPAEIIEWLAEDGDPVSEGQPLVRVQPREGA